MLYSNEETYWMGEKKLFFRLESIQWLELADILVLELEKLN